MILRKFIIGTTTLLSFFCVQITYDVLVYKRCNFASRTLLIYLIVSFMFSLIMIFVFDKFFGKR